MEVQAVHSASVTTSLFGFELRVLACDRCGAPVQSPRAGGTVACSYCGASNHLASRDDRPVAAAQLGSEAIRVERLRQQDAAPTPVPPGLESLVAEDGIPPERMQEAKAAWAQARFECRAGAGLPAQARLFYLAVAQLDDLSDRNRDEELRSVLETSLEHLTDQRHRQVLHARLSELAARAGDVEAARQWLSLCTPQADDLQMDTMYRLAAAYLATAEGDHATVIRHLGYRSADVPLADAYEELCSLLRANALERSGAGQASFDQLQPIALRGNLSRLRARHARLQLCPQTANRAESAAGALRGDLVKLRKLGEADMDWPLKLFAVWGLATVVGGVVSLITGDSRFVIVAGMGGMMVSVVGGAVLRNAYISKTVRSYVDGRATVISRRLTGDTNSNGSKQVEVTWYIEPQGRPAYLATSGFYYNDQARKSTKVGTVLSAKIPLDRQLANIEFPG